MIGEAAPGHATARGTKNRFIQPMSHRPEPADIFHPLENPAG
jgi:hypothetical protein